MYSSISWPKNKILDLTLDIIGNDQRASGRDTASETGLVRAVELRRKFVFVG
jgi:hypothetical protein